MNCVMENISKAQLEMAVAKACEAGRAKGLEEAARIAHSYVDGIASQTAASVAHGIGDKIEASVMVVSNDFTVIRLISAERALRRVRNMCRNAISAGYLHRDEWQHVFEIVDKELK